MDPSRPFGATDERKRVVTADGVVGGHDSLLSSSDSKSRDTVLLSGPGDRAGHPAGVERRAPGA